MALLAAVELPEGLGSDGARPWLDAQLAALDALGRSEEAQALRRRFALERLSLPHLRAYLQQLPAFQNGEAEQELLEVLHRWPDQRRAARLIETQPEQLNGTNEPLLNAMAAGLETRHPLAASLCLRAMVEEVLELAPPGQRHQRLEPVSAAQRLRARAAARLRTLDGLPEQDRLGGLLLPE